MSPEVEEAEAAPKVPDLLELQAVAGPCDGQDLSTAGQVLSVGRTKLSKIHIKDPAVSEKHAEFSWSGSGWMLRDLGSSNGTAVNGTKLQSEGKAVALKNGDTVLFGTESKVRIQIKPVIYDDLTIEQIINAECDRIEQEIKARVEQLVSESQQQWQTVKHQLQTAHMKS